MIHSSITYRVLTVALLLSGNLAFGQDDLTRRSSWDVPSVEQVQSQLKAWLAEREVTAEQQQQIDALWTTAPAEAAPKTTPTAVNPSETLRMLVESAAIVWPEAEELVAETRQLKVGPVVKHFEFLKREPVNEAVSEAAEAKENAATDDAAPEEPAVEEQSAEEPTAEEPAPEEANTEEAAEAGAKVPPTPANLNDWMLNNLRLHYARWLAQHELYDESLELIEPIEVAEVVDPASLLFYQSAAYHYLLNKTKGLATIEKLLENEQSVARRYSMTAKLMAADLKPLKVDSLDEVARMMDDIERRLRLQRAGTHVRQEEDDVVAKLDKMIEELEKQQQSSSSSSSGAGNSNNPSAPMQDSQIGGASGEGNVDPKRLNNRENWGNLPPKERQEALQQITKELPAHYREAVEEYFRKLARDGANP